VPFVVAVAFFRLLPSWFWATVASGLRARPRGPAVLAAEWITRGAGAALGMDAGRAVALGPAGEVSFAAAAAMCAWLAGLVVGAAVIAWKWGGGRSERTVLGMMAAVGLGLVLAPVASPWIAVWIMPLVVYSARRSWLVFSCVVTAVFARPLFVPHWLAAALVWAALCVMLVLETRARRRLVAAAGGARPSSNERREEGHKE
jgi:hypothetical protein